MGRGWAKEKARVRCLVRAQGSGWEQQAKGLEAVQAGQDLDSAQLVKG